MDRTSARVKTDSDPTSDAAGASSEVSSRLIVTHSRSGTD